MADSPTRKEAIATLAELIKDIPVAMLTTTTDRGWLRSRPMVTQSFVFDGDRWFFAGRSTAKARDVRNRHQVNLGYMSVEQDRYVSVSGVALVVEDTGKVKAFWDERYKEWFPKGVGDPEVVLIKVQVEEAEYWDRREHRMIQVTGFIEPPAGFREPGTGV
jgi:general stress protein 26